MKLDISLLMAILVDVVHNGHVETGANLAVRLKMIYVISLFYCVEDLLQGNGEMDN